MLGAWGLGGGRFLKSEGVFCVFCRFFCFSRGVGVAVSYRTLIKAVLMWGNCGERKEVALLARVALTTVGVCGCGLYSGVCVARLARGERVFSVLPIWYLRSCQERTNETKTVRHHRASP